MFKSIILHNRTALTILTVKTRTNRILPLTFVLIAKAGHLKSYLRPTLVI